MNLSDAQIKNGWSIVKLGDCINKIIGGGTPSKSNPSYWNGGIPWASVKDMSDGNYRLDKTQDNISEIGLHNSASNLISSGTVVVSTRMGLGRIFINKIDIAINQDLKAIIPNEKIDNNFLLYAYINKSEEIKRLGTGSTVSGIRLDDIKNLKILLPPISTQKDIASTLSTYDNLIENNEKRIKILESMAQKLYSEWFVKNNTANGYQKASLDSVAVVHRGKSYSSEDIKDVEGIPFVNLKCVNRYGGFRYDGLKAFSGEYKESHVVRNGDIVMAVTDMTQERMIVARVARIPSLDGGFGVISMDLVKIEPKENTNKSWLYCFLRYSGLGDKLKNSANGANVLHLNPSRISEYELSVPPFEVQDSFANLVENMLLLQEKLLVENRNLQRARDLLIPQLVSGKILIKE
jgi:type I restriction enzyme, S subunit